MPDQKGKAESRKKDDSYITLGWQVTPTLEPRFWLNPNAKPGRQQESDLVRVNADRAGTHTAIIAQSGSGKSFFLGRLIEELILSTKARCLVFDPNADFRQVHRVEEKIWGYTDETGKRVEPSYDLISRGGKLPHEEDAAKFSQNWPSDSIVIKTIGVSGSPFEHLKLWWPSVSVDFFVEGANPTLRSQLYYCHTFIRELATLAALKAKAENISIDLIETGERLLKESRKFKADFEAILRQEFDLDKIAPIPATTKIDPKQGLFSLKFLQNMIRKWERRSAEQAIVRASKAPDYVTPSAQRFYFATVGEFNEGGILETLAEKRPESTPLKRIEVIDLPALKSRATQLLAINAILQTEWDLARQRWNTALNESEEKDVRVPTFIIVDEAHNLMPAEPEGRAERALRDQFRRIIAEGRKYGLFLILVSQRPDKLDPLIVSECENRAVMKLSSRAVLDKTRQMLGLEDIPTKTLDRCLEFELGRALLVGNWAPNGPLFAYSCPRRTKEGGRNLRKSHWAKPETNEPKSDSTKELNKQRNDPEK